MPITNYERYHRVPISKEESTFWLFWTLLFLRGKEDRTGHIGPSRRTLKKMRKRFDKLLSEPKKSDGIVSFLSHDDATQGMPKEKI